MHKKKAHMKEAHGKHHTVEKEDGKMGKHSQEHKKAVMPAKKAHRAK